MGIFDKMEKGVSASSLPDECKLYFHYVQYYLDGFEFKDNVSLAAIRMLKNEYANYQNFKDTTNFKTATNKYNSDTFLKDFIKESKCHESAKALAFLLMYDIMTYYSYSGYGNAVAVFKDYLRRNISNLDRNKIPESFFCYYRADEIFEKEKSLAQKYLDLYDEYVKVKSRLAEYEDE